jgi:hypothetical protein
MRDIAAGTSYGGHGPLEAHFGLGDASEVDSVRVEWPSGLLDVRTRVAPDGIIRIVESSATPVLGAVLASGATSGGAAVEWDLTGREGEIVTIQRSPAGSGWLDHAWSAVPSNGHLRFIDREVDPGARYGYRILLAGGPVPLGEVWIDIPGGGLPGLLRVTPNPSRGPVAFEARLDRPGALSIAILDVSGRIVRVLPAGHRGAGTHFVSWDGRDADGQPVAAGRYYARIVGSEPTHGTTLAISRSGR